MASMLHDRALTVPVDCSHCTEPDTQRPSSYQERSGTASRKCGPQKTPARKAKLLAAAARLPKDSAGRFIGSADACAEVGLGSSNYITRCLLPSVVRGRPGR